MAIVALVCPQCGASLELEDTRDFAFCTFCGAKVMLHETIEVKHSGSVKMDNSDRAKNRLDIAERAFASMNYKEAYDYYTKVLEDFPKDPITHLRKGLSAIYCSVGGNIRFKEFEVELVTAMKLIKDSNSIPELMKIANGDLLTLYRVGKKSLGVIPKSFDSVEACINIEADWVNYIVLTDLALKFISNEAYREEILKEAVAFCDSIGDMPYTEIRDNKYVAKKYKIKYQFFYDFRTKFSGLYDELPGRKDKFKALSHDMEVIDAKIEDKKNSLANVKSNYSTTVKTYFASNDVARKERLTKNLLSFIPGGVVLVLAAIMLVVGLIMGVINSETSQVIVYASIVAASLGVGLLIIFALLILINKNRWMVKKLPDDIKVIRDDIKAQEKEMKEFKKEKSGIQKEIKQFNSQKL